MNSHQRRLKKAEDLLQQVKDCLDNKLPIDSELRSDIQRFLNKDGK